MAEPAAPGARGGPLTGVRVVDITTIFMGPSATQMLGDLGADVIKVESPGGGDVVRGIGPQGDQRMGPLFLAMNRNKRSIGLDLKHPEGRAALLELARGADVLTYNVRPQAMARLGLDYETLAAINPRLIVVGMFGFSQRRKLRRQRRLRRPDPGRQRLSRRDRPRATGGPPRATCRSPWPTAPWACTPSVSSARRCTRANAPAAASASTCRCSKPWCRRCWATTCTATPSCRLSDFRLPAPALARAAALYHARRPRLLPDLHRRAVARRGHPARPGLFDSDALCQHRHPHAPHHRAVRAGEEIGRRTTAEMQALLAEADIPVFPMHTLESLLDDGHLHDIGFFSETEHPGSAASARWPCPASGRPRRRPSPRPRRVWASTAAPCCARSATTKPASTR